MATNLNPPVNWLDATDSPVLSDPEFLNSMAREVRGRLGQLENSWEMLNNPVSEAEADRVLAAVFPDEPRA